MMVLAHFDSLIDPLLQQISLQLRLQRDGRKSLGTISHRQRHVLMTSFASSNRVRKN